MKKVGITVLSIVLLSVQILTAQVPQEVVLIPVAFNPGVILPGAHGTEWTGELWLHNESGNAYHPQPVECPGIGPCGFHSEYLGIVSQIHSNHIDGGALFYFQKEDAPHIFMSNRIYEKTQDAQPLGVEIPVVREADFLTGPSEYLGIPTNPDHRISVRVYDPRRDPESRVRLVIFDSMEETIGETILYPGHIVPDTTAAVPGYAAIHGLADHFPQIAQHEVVHFRIEPLVEGMQYWGFVTITENETQHVTLVTPQ